MQFPAPTSGPGEVVIEMNASSMCKSDLKLYRTPKGEDPGIGIKLSGPVVAGQGAVSRSTTLLASAMGLRVIALDIEEHRLARTKEFGA